MLAKVIAIEGPDKVGKETQSKMLAHALRQLDNRVTLVEVPFNDRVTHKLIYWMLRAGWAERLPNVFQFVQFCNKFVFQCLVLPFLLLFNEYVVLDRWSLSAIVYGDATGANKLFNRLLYWFLWRADLTVILHGPRRSDDEHDSYESDSALQRAVREGYYNWHSKHPWDHDLVDNQGDRDQVHERVRDAVLSVSA